MSKRIYRRTDTSASVVLKHAEIKTYIKTYMNPREKKLFSLPEVQLVSPELSKRNYHWRVCLGS